MINKSDDTIPSQYRSISHSEDTIRDEIGAVNTGRLKVGDVILGQYEILSELGQGGMGVVYRCMDKTGGVEVAVKALPPELSHSASEMEEVRENYQLVSELVHENIAACKTLARDGQTGDYYLVMELVRGEELKTWARRCRREGKMSLATILPIMRQVASALDFAHKKKIMHRDIKPSNIMVEADGTVKVLDFGLAAQIRSSMSHVSMAYTSRSGTNLYKSPEQWRGKPQGRATDLYALAVTTYEMLAGHVPFDDEDIGVLKRAVLEESPDPIEGLEDSANKALMVALSKDPKDRYESCVDFVNALVGVKVNVPSGNAKAGRAAHSMWKIDKRVVIGAATIIVVLLALCVLIPSINQKNRNNELSTVLAPNIGHEKQELNEEMKLSNKNMSSERQDSIKEQQGPCINIRTIINGREVKATSAKGEKTPLVLKNLESNERVSNRFVYQYGNNIYIGMLEEIVDWKGMKEVTVELKKSDGKVVVLPNNEILELIEIKAGGFLMGSPSSEQCRSSFCEKQHRVNLTRNYWLGKYEITQGQWKAVMGTTLLDQAEKAFPGKGKMRIAIKDINYPMYYISWDDAMEFCKKLTEIEQSAGRLPNDYEYTLPTEAQWEYACRAGTTTALYTGEINILGERNAPALDKIAWYGGNSSVNYKGYLFPVKQLKDELLKERQYSGDYAGPRKVGDKLPNSWGLYDMLGNVAEWCRDWYEDDYAKDAEFLRGNSGAGKEEDQYATDPDFVRREQCQFTHVLKGGDWLAEARMCRSAFRGWGKPDVRIVNVGFRIALVRKG